MIFKAFEYEHSKENILEFLKFWISSEEFLKDIKKGSFVGSSRKTVRDVKHTIVISKNGLLELSIKKGAIIHRWTMKISVGVVPLPK